MSREQGFHAIKQLNKKTFVWVSSQRSAAYTVYEFGI